MSVSARAHQPSHSRYCTILLKTRCTVCEIRNYRIDLSVVCVHFAVSISPCLMFGSRSRLKRDVVCGLLASRRLFDSIDLCIWLLKKWKTNKQTIANIAKMHVKSARMTFCGCLFEWENHIAFPSRSQLLPLFFLKEKQSLSDSIPMVCVIDISGCCCWSYCLVGRVYIAINMTCLFIVGY